MVTTSTIVDEPTGLTAPWLTEVLRAAGVDATVADVSVEPVGTGQMAACHRLTITYARGDGPAALIAKLPSSDPDVRSAVATTYRTEVCFYRDLAPRLPVSAPRAWCAAVTDDATAFTLLLDDMTPAVAGDQIAGCTVDQARDAAVAAAGLHAGSWCDPAIAALDWLIPPMRDVADHMGPMLQDAVGTFLGERDLDAATADVFRRFADGFAGWTTARATPTSLVHNDYRLDNLLFAPAGADVPAVTVVDWQSLTTGEPLRDVGFLLGTGLDPEARRAHEREIVGAYHAALTVHGVDGYDADRCWDDYRHGLFQGPLISILGDAFATPTERGLRMFSVMAERSATAIRDLDCLDLLA
jgi:hypothetical protein